MLPTQSPEALMSFVQGRNAFQVYLGSGRSEDLKRAHEDFSAAHRDDPSFDMASFYLAVASTELRDSNAAIDILKPLTGREVDFLPEAFLQLAYAYTKTYDLYPDAQNALDRANEEARKRSRNDLVPVIQASKVFLFSVMSGQYPDKRERPLYGEQAIELGRQLLADQATLRHSAKDQILFELHNALGIAYWRKGENEAEFSPVQQSSWRAANEHFEQALRTRPNATRTMQNLGSLLVSEGDQYARAGEPAKAEESYKKAQEAYLKSLALNPLDQFPHYRLAHLAARLGDWQVAQQYFDSGRQQRGAVKPNDWERLKNAIDRRNPADLCKKN